jgi:DNA repair photolyase
MRPLVFTLQRWGDAKLDLDPIVGRCPEGSAGLVGHLLGHIQTVRLTHPRHDDQEKDHVCWPTLDFGTMVGCPHGCQYCGQGKDGTCIIVAVNMEHYVEEVVGPTMAENPWQRCFRMIGWGADHLSFEPESGLFDLFTRKAAEHDRYAYFHTAGANVDWIADLPRKDRLIGVWSVTCDAVARLIEPGSGPPVERFDAAATCQAMGVPARLKFKPIIPVRNWREEYAAAIEALFARVRPESVGFCTFIWNSYEQMCEKLPVDLLDPDIVAAARDAQDAMRDSRLGPFPHETRREIYRFFIQQARRWDADVPLYISTESREMWDELKDELGQDPRAYVCGCSSVAVPGRRLKLSDELRYSTYSPTAS